MSKPHLQYALTRTCHSSIVLGASVQCLRTGPIKKGGYEMLAEHSVSCNKVCGRAPLPDGRWRVRAASAWLSPSVDSRARRPKGVRCNSR